MRYVLNTAAEPWKYRLYLDRTIDVVITHENLYEKLAAIIAIEIKIGKGYTNFMAIAWTLEHFYGVQFSHYTYKHLFAAMTKYGLYHLTNKELLKQWLDCYFETMNKVECWLVEETGIGLDACLNP